MLRSVFIVEEIEMVSTIIDLALTKQDVFTFTHTELDCHHFIADFMPEVVLLDLETASGELGSFIDKYYGDQVLAQIPLVSFGEKAPQGHEGRFKGHIQKPFAPLQIKAQLEEILNS